MYGSWDPLYIEGEMALEEQDDKGAILQSTRLGYGDEISIQEHEGSLSATNREGKFVPCKLSMVYWCQNIGIRAVLCFLLEF